MASSLSHPLLLAAATAFGAGCSDEPRAPGRDESEAPGFFDVTAASGLRFRHVNGAAGEYHFVETNGSGLGVFDYDDDGDLDLYLVQGGALPGYPEPGPFTSRLFRNDGGMEFTDVTAAAGCGATVYGTGCLLGDYDGDSRPDVFVYGFGPNQLFRNRGDGTFEDVTKRAGVGDPRYAGAAAYGDFDRDGDLDLFVGNYVKWSFESHVTCANPPAPKTYCHPDSFDPEPDLLYRNEGNGTFTEVSSAAGIRRLDGKALGALVGDVDDDGDLDLFVANDSTRNFLYRNDGKPGELRFTDVSEASCVAFDRDGRTQGCMGCDFADIDGDLDPDLIVTNLAMESNALYVNQGNALFDDQAARRGIERTSLIEFGWGVRLFDFDLDLDADMLVTNGHLHGGVTQYDASQRYAQLPRLLLNDGGGRFLPAGPEVGGPLLDTPCVGRGSVLADLDGDGDLDLAINTNAHDASLWERRGRPQYHWLGLELRGAGRNPAALGARVDVTAGGRTQLFEVRGAASFASWQDLRVHAGLAANVQADRVLVRWPLGRLEEYGPLAADRYHVLVEGQGRRGG